MRGIGVILLISVFLSLSLFLSAEEAKAKNPWGTYRPNLYFGMKTKATRPTMFGLFWFNANQNFGFSDIKHDSQSNRGPYGWKKHSETWGRQEIVENELGIKLTTTFLTKPEGDWVVRVEGSKIKETRRKPRISLHYYLTSEEPETTIKLKSKNRKGLNEDEARLRGHNEALGHFTLLPVEDPKNEVLVYSDTEEDIIGTKSLPDLSKFHFMAMNVSANFRWRTHDFSQKFLEHDYQRLIAALTKLRAQAPDFHVNNLVPIFTNLLERDSNSYVMQKIYSVPFQVDLVYLSKNAHSANDKAFTDTQENNVLSKLSGEALTTLFNEQEALFDRNFEEAFHLKRKGYSKKYVEFGMAAFSNVLGGIGHFAGRSRLRDAVTGEEIPGKFRTLLTGTPSRSFFPRGFLWDEGFHQLIIQYSREDISMEVIQNWFTLMEPSGWIPREQILGLEARSRVPEEFQIQNPQHANPPTLLLPLLKISQRMAELRRNISSSVEASMDVGLTEDPVSTPAQEQLDKYEKYFREIVEKADKWIKWFERTQKGEYPHGSPVHFKNCWRWRGRTENHTLPSGLDDYPRTRFPNQFECHVDLMSWMAFAYRSMAQIHEDLDSESLAREYHEKYQEVLKDLDAIHWDPEQQIYSDVVAYNQSTNTITHSKHVGYVSLFPLSLGLIPKNSPKLMSILKTLRDENQLWTNYGIRSLSKADPNYQKDENYWRGAIWINVNYLLLSSLHKNYISDNEVAAELYNSLRTNLVNNIYSNHQNTGFFWESYYPDTGKGKGTQPFNGWTSLVLLIMSELY